jgi:endoglucanase
MENFITDHPGTESQERRALSRVLGVDHLASLGINCRRVPFSCHHVEDDAAPFVLSLDP